MKNHWLIAIISVILVNCSVVGQSPLRIAATVDLPDVLSSESASDHSAICAEAPRLVAPLSGSILRGDRPTLRWESNGAYVDICLDSQCEQIVVSQYSTTSLTLEALPARTYYWRVRNEPSRACPEQRVSNIWQLRITGSETNPHQHSIIRNEADFNRDGFADLVVSLSEEVRVYWGGPSGVSHQFSRVHPRSTGVDADRVAVTSVGDINGDGFGDLVVGEAQANDDSGQVTVYWGSVAGLNSKPQQVIRPARGEPSQFGASIAVVGDVDEDGYADVVVGAPNASGERGLAYLFLGSSSGLNGATAAIFTGLREPNTHFGTSVSSAGDFNNDGELDVIIGAPGSRSGEGAAMVFLLHHNAREVTVQATIQLFTAPLTRGAGSVVRAAGDLNHDGFDDVLVGASESYERAGAVWNFLGNDAGEIAMNEWQGPAMQGQFGAAIGSPFDFNRDGQTDIVVGSPSENQGVGQFRVMLSNLQPDYFPTNVRWLVVLCNHARHRFGQRVNTSDFNGDGFDDIAVSSDEFTVIYLGNSSGLIAVNDTIAHPRTPQRLP